MSLVEQFVEDGIGWLKLNRPEKLNALSSVLLAEFDTVFAELSGLDDVRCIVVHGAGRAFSVGYDLAPENNLFADPNGDRIRSFTDWRFLRSTIDRWLRVWRCEKPVIGAVHGYCMGGATQLAVCCDLTLLAEGTVIGWPMLPIGGGLLAPVSEWLIGPKRAKEMSFIPGNKFTAEEAVAWGWANRVVPGDELLDIVGAMARKIAKVPPEVMMIKKRALNRVMDLQGFAESLYFGAEFDAIAHDSEGCVSLAEQLEELGLKEAIKAYHGDDL